jgi:hypothetical protein
MLISLFSFCVAASSAFSLSPTGEAFPARAGWTTEPVVVAVDAGDSLGIAAIAVGGQGGLQVVFEDWTGDAWDQRHLSWTACVDGEWQAPEVIADEAPFAHGAAARTNYLPALAVDPNGWPHVSFRAPYSRQGGNPEELGGWRINSLEQAFRQSDGVWLRQRVDDVLGDEGSSSLGIDDSGRIVIAYRWRHQRFDDDIAVVRSTDSIGSGWLSPCDLVREPGNQEHVSLALTPGGAPRVVCTATVPESQGRGKRIGLAVATAADEGDSTCVFGSFVFRKSDRFLLPGFGVASHMDNAALAVGGPEGAEERTLVVFNASIGIGEQSIYYSYAETDPQNPLSWSAPQLLDEDATHPSLAIDAAGHAWVVYQKRMSGANCWAVHVITGEPEHWSLPRRIDFAATDQRVEWEEPAIVVDGSNVVHLVYNVNRREIRHAWRQLGSEGHGADRR